MKNEIASAVAHHPISTTVATAAASVPVANWLDLSSDVVSLVAGCMAIGVSYFFIQYHRANTRLKVYRLNRMIEEDNKQDGTDY